MESEGIYLLREREFARLNENIYKIGRSINIKTRMNSYPKGSDIELMMGCNDSIKCEKQLLEIFRNTFIQRKEYGSEYFEGDKQEMIAIITNFLNKSKKEDARINIEKIEKIEQPKININTPIDTLVSLYTNDMDIIEIDEILFWKDKNNIIYEITSNNELGCKVGKS
jgi:hypothetical protein